MGSRIHTPCPPRHLSPSYSRVGGIIPRLIPNVGMLFPLEIALCLLISLSSCYRPQRATLTLTDATESHHLDWALVVREEGDSLWFSPGSFSRHQRMTLTLREPTLFHIEYGPSGGKIDIIVCPQEKVHLSLREGTASVTGSRDTPHLQHFDEEYRAMRTRTKLRGKSYERPGMTDSLRLAILEDQKSDNRRYREKVKRFIRQHHASRVSLLLVEQHPFADTPLFSPLYDSLYLDSVIRHYLAFFPGSLHGQALKERLHLARRRELLKATAWSDSTPNPALLTRVNPHGTPPPRILRLQLIHAGSTPPGNELIHFTQPPQSTAQDTLSAIRLTIRWIEPMDGNWRAWNVSESGMQRINGPEALDSLWLLSMRLGLHSTPSYYLTTMQGYPIFRSHDAQTVIQALDSIPPMLYRLYGPVSPTCTPLSLKDINPQGAMSAWPKGNDHYGE